MLSVRRATPLPGLVGQEALPRFENILPELENTKADAEPLPFAI